MGKSIIAKCKNCENTFKANEGGGVFFHLLHCDRCGREINISIELADGLNVQSHLEFKGYDHDQARIEASLEKCICLGTFKFNAKPRCPLCLAEEFEELEFILLYD